MRSVRKLPTIMRKNGLRDLTRTVFALGSLIAPCFTFASDIRGTVINGTTGRHAAGDQVVLLTLSQDGMNESARAKTDSQGRFRFVAAEKQATYLIRAVHDGVTYHKKVEPDTKSVAVRVYDAAEKVDGVTAIMDVERFEATGDVLEVKQLVTMRNASKPPRTLMNARPFELQLPPEAQIQSGLVQTSDGQPLKQMPVGGEQKGRYYFLFPLRPGDTRFAVVYRLPYSGEAWIEPKIRSPLERFVIMLPKSMKFEPRAPDIFQPMPDTTPDNVQGTGPMRPDQVVAFRIAGTGTLEELRGRRKQAEETEQVQAQRPGGGLGPPIQAPDPLREERWPILGGLSVLVGVGATWAMSRRPRSQPPELPSTPLPQEAMRLQDPGTPVPMNRRQKRRAPFYKSTRLKREE
jgi:hypothetical protein